MSKHEQMIRVGYQAAEGAAPDVEKFLSLFNDDGVIYDVASGTKFRGAERGLMLKTFATAFPDMHREIFGLNETNDLVVVELSLNGTHKGPLVLPAGTLPPTGKEMRTPCCDVFHFKNGKIQTFNCYAAGTIMFMQLGVLGNLGAALKQ
jgi:predicted ester cyclase